MFYVDSQQRQKRKGTQLIRRDYSEMTFSAVRGRGGGG